MNLLLIIFLLLASLLYAARAQDYNIFCYWNTTAFYRTGRSKYHSWNIDGRLCTHMAYAYFGIAETGIIKRLDEYLDIESDYINSFLRLKRRSASNIKLLASVGGWAEGSQMFSKVVTNMHIRDAFFSSVVQFLNSSRFDGLDVAWEYPTRRGRRAEDRNNFVLFLEELKLILQEQKLLLSVAVAARTDAATLAAYDIPNIAKHVDLINLITHDFERSNGAHVAHTAPLYGTGDTVDRAVRHWVQQSGTASKLLLGIPLFGQTYTLQSRESRNVGAVSKGPGRRTKMSNQPGFMAYNEFCIQSAWWTKKFDRDAQVPYAYRGNQWISFEDAASINEKMRLVKELKLGGAMVWSIDMDDFQGECGEQYGLMRVINSIIGDPDALTTQAPTTSGPGMCWNDGFFRHPWYCEYYYECRAGQRIDYECLAGEYFDSELGYCNQAEMVKCPQHFVTWRPGMQKFNMFNMPVNLKIVK